MDSLSVGARDDFASKNEEEREGIRGTLTGSRGSLTANPHISVVQSPYSLYISIAHKVALFDILIYQYINISALLTNIDIEYVILENIDIDIDIDIDKDIIENIKVNNSSVDL